MSNYPVTPEENYDAICEEMKRLADELEKNPTILEDRFHKILERYGRLGRMLEDYAKMMWEK